MLNNFHLVAIAKTKGVIQLFHIPLHQLLQDSLAGIWWQQYEAFMDGIQEIPFNAGYSPESHERFCLEGYRLPDEFEEETHLTVQNLDKISEHEDQFEAIKAIVGFARDHDNKELVLFQNFSRSHVIKPHRFLLLESNTYKSVERPGLTLDNKLSVVYNPEAEKLLFQNFRAANTFLPLADFYEEASEEDIKSVLSHNLLTTEDAEAHSKGANQWFRKRFAMLNDSGILDRYTAQQIADHSGGYAVDIQLKGDKIVFPADKTSAKKVLQFLNEEIFRGAITDTLYETNSKREAD
jgi:hypothetical protein